MTWKCVCGYIWESQTLEQDRAEETETAAKTPEQLPPGCVEAGVPFQVDLEAMRGVLARSKEEVPQVQPEAPHPISKQANLIGPFDKNNLVRCNKDRFDAWMTVPGTGCDGYLLPLVKLEQNGNGSAKVLSIFYECSECRRRME